MNPHAGGWFVGSLERPLFAASLIGILAIIPFCGSAGPRFRTVTTIAFSPDGRYLATGLYNGRRSKTEGRTGDTDCWSTIALIDLRSKGAPRTLTSTMTPPPRHPLSDWPVGSRQLRFQNDGKCLAAYSGSERGPAGGTVDVWDVETGRKEWSGMTHEWRGVDEFVDGIGAPLNLQSSDGRWLADAAGGVIRLLDTKSNVRRDLAGSSGLGAEQIALFPDGNTLVALGYFAVYLIDRESGKLIGLAAPPGGPGWTSMTCVAVSPDGRYVATGDTLGDVTIRDAATLEPLRTMRLEGRFRWPWTLPAGLFVIWVLTLWITIRRGLFTTPRRSSGNVRLAEG